MPKKIKMPKVIGEPIEDIVKQSSNPYLGLHAQDKITGFRGLITGFCQHLTGCDSYCLTPWSTDTNTKPEAHWFDDIRLEILESDKVVLEVNTKYPGKMDLPPTC